MSIRLPRASLRVAATLGDMLAVLGDRRLTVCRELTKLHEEVWRTTVGKALERYRREEPRGEFTLAVEGLPKEELEPELESDLELASDLELDSDFEPDSLLEPESPLPESLPPPSAASRSSRERRRVP